MSKDIPNFFEFSNGIEHKNGNVSIVQDQDTVIGDAMCHAAQIVYDVSKGIARCISENAQYAINLKGLKRAELALAYMQGADFGLAIDDKKCKLYLKYMERTMASIERSKEAGFQLQIEIPPQPSKFLGYDETHCRAMGDLFIHSLHSTPPSNSDIQRLESEQGFNEVVAPNDDALVEDESVLRKNKCSPKNVVSKRKKEIASMITDPANDKTQISKDIQNSAGDANIEIDNMCINSDDVKDLSKWNVSLDIVSNEGTKDYGELANKIKDGLISRGYSSVSISNAGDNRKFVFSITTESAKVEDSKSEVAMLRNLYRTNRISKESLNSSLATLLALGRISKTEYNGLQKAI